MYYILTVYHIGNAEQPTWRYLGVILIIDELKYKAIKQDLFNVMNSLALVCSEFVSIELTQKAKDVTYSKKGDLIIVDFTTKKDE